MKRIAIILIVFVAGCGKQSAPLPTKTVQTTQVTIPKPMVERKEPKSIGPQFWVYDLSPYKIVDQNVVSGPGGRWISVKYQKKPDEKITREELISRISSSLATNQWSKQPLPDQKYVLSTVWDNSREDLHFTRSPKADEPEHWSFSQIIHISSNADVVCLYCEVGW